MLPVVRRRQIFWHKAAEGDVSTPKHGAGGQDIDLDGVLGPNKARVTCAAELNFNQITKRVEDYDPDQRVIIAQQRDENASSGTPSGNENSESSITNYDGDVSIENIISEVGNLRRLSVSVVVDGVTKTNKDGTKEYTPRSDSVLNRIEDLVKKAVGYTFNENREDQVAVTNLQFDNSFIEEQLALAQSEISMLRMQLMQASEQNSRLAGTLEDRDQQIIVILSEKAQLEENLNRSRQEIAVVSSEAEQIKGELSRIQANFRQQSEALQATRDQIIVLTEQKDSANQALTALKDDFGNLKVKYDRLIKPARTARGKYVVSVNYERVDGKERIRFKDAGDKSYRSLNRKELHAALAKLKEVHKKKLYIKLVIPKESGLTYSEAWTFMKEVLEKYDYYYQ